MPDQKSFLVNSFSQATKNILVLFILFVSFTGFVEILAQPPTAEFTATPSGGCEPLIVEFVDYSSGPASSIEEWIINYGDGTANIDTFHTAPSTWEHTYQYSSVYTAVLRVKDAVGNIDYDSVDISVSDRPGVDFFVANPQTSFCVNEPVELEYFFTTGNTHIDELKWYFGDDKTSTSKENPITHKYEENGNYKVQLIATLGECADTVEHPVNVQGPKSSFTISDTAGCINDEMTFTLGTSSGVTTYTWYPEGENGPAISDVSPYTHTYTSWDLYTPYLEVKDATYTCRLYDTTVHIFHVEALIGYKDIAELCEDRNVYFNNLSYGNDNNLWDLGNGNTTSDLDPVESYQAGDYTVKLNVSNTFGCEDNASAELKINEIPEITVGPDVSVCIGDSANISASGGHTIEWKPSRGVGSVNAYETKAAPTVTTVYSPVVRDTVTQCSSVQGSDTLIVTVIEVPEVIFNIEVPDTIIIGDTVYIEIDSNPNFNYLWSPDQYISCTDCANPILQPLNNGENSYMLEMSDIYACGTTDTTIHIYVREEYTFGVPEAFTPNGDGINDIIKVNGWGIKELQEFTIYDRWGKKVFSTTNINEGWDGTFDGKDQGVDTYTYYIKIVQWDDVISEKRGAIALYR